MLICPLLSHTSAKTFRHLSAAVRAADEARRPRGEQQIAIADFHPIAAVDLTTPERLVPYLRRAPDPMLQIVRTDVLARVRRSQAHGTAYVDPAQLASLVLDQLSPQTPALAERVAQANLHAVQSCGVDKLEAVLSDIHADRTRAYAALGVPAPTPAHNAHMGDAAQETAFVSASNSDEKPESKAGYCRAGNLPYIDPALRKCNDI